MNKYYATFSWDKLTNTWDIVFDENDTFDGDDGGFFIREFPFKTNKGEVRLSCELSKELEIKCYDNGKLMYNEIVERKQND